MMSLFNMCETKTHQQVVISNEHGYTSSLSYGQQAIEKREVYDRVVKLLRKLSTSDYNYTVNEDK